MDDLAEKRVYADRAGATELVVATAVGLVAVATAAGRVGEYRLARACSPTDVAVAPAPAVGPLAVATDEAVLVAPDGDLDALEPTGFGPATAVTVHDGRVVAAAPDGRLAEHRDGWHPFGELSAGVTALAGDLVGTADGVVRLVDGELRPAGLTDVRDVARAAGVPLAATAAGLYALGNGWLDALEGDFGLVVGGPDGRAHAATADALYARADGSWGPVALPVDDRVVAVAYDERTYAFTDDGTLLAEDADGWRTHPLGLEDVRAAVGR